MEERAARDAFHLYVLGESSAWGEPYAPHIPDLLGRLVTMHFDGRIAGRPVRVVTLAEAGADFARVAARAEAILQRSHAPGTAAVLLYAGHNEFIWRDDHRSLRDNPRRLLDEPVVSPGERTVILSKFAAQLAELAEKLKAAGVPLIVATVAGNVRDWDPNRSVLARPENAAEVTRWWQEADAAFQAGEWERARAAAAALLALEPEFAHAHFLLGRCWLALGDPVAAKRHLQLAADHDANPTRIVSAQNTAIQSLCRERGIPLADTLQQMEQTSPDGLVGFDLIWDNVHPRMEGFLVIAAAFAARLEEVTSTPRAWSSVTLAEAHRVFGLNRELLAHIAAGRGQTCYGHATRTWNTSLRLMQAERYFEEALKVHPEDADILCSVAVMQLMRGETDRSLGTWRRAWKLDEDATRRRIGNLHVRQLFQRQGVKDALAKVRE